MTTPEIISSEITISTEASSRATAYTAANKIIQHDGKLHVTWLDSGQGRREPVRIRTLDLASGEWSPAYSLGVAQDNHGGAAITIDAEGYLHTVFGPHTEPFWYRRSQKPNDATALE